MSHLTIGTRGSDLALAQTRMVAALLQTAHRDLTLDEKLIRTTGDIRLDVPLSNPGALDKGLFTKELERALLDKSIDLAVHSLKDLPTENPAGLTLGAILPRENPDDVLISKSDGGLAGLPLGATVATGSLRRRCFLQWKRPDLRLVELRGNVPTRLRKLHDQAELDAIVLAGAGLRRLAAVDCELALDGVFQSHLDSMLPAPGQGAVAVQCRADDDATLRQLAAIHHPATAIEVYAERAVLSGLGGGCHTPVGVRGLVADGDIQITAAWFHDPEAPPVTASARAREDAWATATKEIIDQLYGQLK